MTLVRPSPRRRPLLSALRGPAGREPGARTRPHGRIGGAVGIHLPPHVVEAFVRSLGPRGRFLHAPATGEIALWSIGEDGGVVRLPDPAGTAPALVADWDACWDGDAPVRDEADWSRIVRAGALHRVEGAFAVAWRSDDEAVHLARDAIGERSLFYAPVRGGLVFASTVHPILEAGLVRRALDPDSLPAYLSYAYVPGARTLVEGVLELLPGETLSVRDGKAVAKPFWRLPAESPGPGDVANEAAKLREVLELAVRRRLPASGPVAASLSGGLDSSTVVALARRMSDEPLRTYSISFGPRYPNELEFSSLVARHCGTEQRIVEIKPRGILDGLDRTLALLSKPIGDPLTVPNALLFREAAGDAAVVLNGEGGDPCFGGPKNLPMVLLELYAGSADDERDPFRRERGYLRAHRRCYDELEAMLAPGLRHLAADGRLEASLAPRFVDPRWPSLVNRLMATNVAFKGAHHILSKVDHLSAAFGVLPRSPLFDRGVVEAALRMPPQLKLRGSVEKHVLKVAAADLLPDAVVHRPKSGMRVPVEAWFAGPLRRHARERLLDGLAPRGLIDRGYLEGLLDCDRSERRRGARIWLLLSLEAWLRGVLGRS